MRNALKLQEPNRKLSWMIAGLCDSPELQNLEKSMPWTEITRPDYDRRGLRYASDTTDEEWALIT